jgi:hypothetical protein
MLLQVQGASMIIGIDPGIKGAIAFYDPTTKHLQTFKMPTFEQPKKGKGNETFVDVKALRKFIVPHKEVPVFIEDIHSIFGTSASSNFKMGYNLGMLHATLDQLIGQYYLVSPTMWQKDVWIDADVVKKTTTKRTDTKATSLNAAKRIFPAHNFIPQGCWTPDDGLVDAALIAFYGGRHEMRKKGIQKL